MQVSWLLRRDLVLWLNQWFTPAVILLELVTYLVVFAFILNNMVPSVLVEGQEVSYISFLVPGILVMNFFITSITSGLLIYMDKRLGILELLLTSPVSRQKIVVSRLMSTAVKCLLGAGLLLLIAHGLGVTMKVDSWRALYIALCCTLFSVTMSALCIVLTVRLKTDYLFNAVTNAFNLPLIFTSPLFYPSESMPALLRKISYVNPLTYGVNTLRPALLLDHVTYFGKDFIIVVGMTAFLVILAVISYEQAMEEVQ